MTVTLLDCMILSAMLVMPFAGMLYAWFIDMLTILDSWFRGDGPEY